MLNTVKRPRRKENTMQELKLQYLYLRTEDIKWKTNTKRKLRIYKSMFWRVIKNKCETKLVYE